MRAVKDIDARFFKWPLAIKLVIMRSIKLQAYVGLCFDRGTKQFCYMCTHQVATPFIWGNFKHA